MSLNSQLDNQGSVYYNLASVPGINEQPIDSSKQRPPANLGFSDPQQFEQVNVNKIDPNNKILDNIVHFNQNLTPDQINETNISNIIKYNNLLNLSEFDKALIAKEYQKIYGMTREANELAQQEVQNNDIMNMSLNEIVDNFTGTMAELLHELPIAYNNGDLMNNGKINTEIFTQGDRMIYVGMFLVLVSIFLYYISLSS